VEWQWRLAIVQAKAKKRAILEDRLLARVITKYQRFNLLTVKLIHIVAELLGMLQVMEKEAVDSNG
jgi:hypothetical protein